MLDAIMPNVAWLVVGALFTIPQIWGLVVILSLLGHLTQFLPKKK